MLAPWFGPPTGSWVGRWVGGRSSSRFIWRWSRLLGRARDHPDPVPVHLHEVAGGDGAAGEDHDRAGAVVEVVGHEGAKDQDVVGLPEQDGPGGGAEADRLGEHAGAGAGAPAG